MIADDEIVSGPIVIIGRVGGRAGDSLDVPVVIKDIASVGSAQFTATYDHSVFIKYYSLTVKGVKTI